MSSCESCAGASAPRDRAPALKRRDATARLEDDPLVRELVNRGKMLDRGQADRGLSIRVLKGQRVIPTSDSDGWRMDDARGASPACKRPSAQGD